MIRLEQTVLELIKQLTHCVIVVKSVALNLFCWCFLSRCAVQRLFIKCISYCICVCVCVFESIFQVCQMAPDIFAFKNKHKFPGKHVNRVIFRGNFVSVPFTPKKIEKLVLRAFISLFFLALGHLKIIILPKQG